MEYKDIYSLKEVMQILAKNNTATMKIIGDNKEFVVEGSEVLCYRRNLVFPDKVLNTYSFKYVWEELWKK